MITIELHNDDVRNVLDGSLVAAIGDTNTETWHAETRLEEVSEMYGSNILRAYFLRDGVPMAAWLPSDDGFKSIGCDPDYDGEWAVSSLYVDPQATRIAVAHLGHDALLGLDGGVPWARQKLAGAVATAILVDGDGIVAAWERGDRRHGDSGGDPVLVAKGPERPVVL